MNSCYWLVEYKELLAFPRQPFVHAKVSAGGCGAGYCWAVVIAIKETKVKFFCFRFGILKYGVLKISEIPGNCDITIYLKISEVFVKAFP